MVGISRMTSGSSRSVSRFVLSRKDGQVQAGPPKGSADERLASWLSEIWMVGTADEAAPTRQDGVVVLAGC